MSKLSFNPKSKKLYLVIALGSLVIILVAFFALNYYGYYLRFHPKDGVLRYSTDTPSEQKINDKNYKWVGKANDPKKIIIPSIGVDSFIQKIGIDQNKEVTVPSNIYLVGWFVDTVRPGEKGLSLMDGHVTGRKNDGVFKNLEKLNKGDSFSIIFGNGERKRFRVFDKKSVPEKESVAIMFSQDPSVTHQLNLVTCSGKYDDKLRQYDERLTVMTKLVE